MRKILHGEDISVLRWSKCFSQADRAETLSKTTAQNGDGARAYGILIPFAMIPRS